MNTPKRRFEPILAGWCFLLLLASCSSAATQSPATASSCKTFPLEIFVQAAKQVNLNEEGQPMPVEVRAYLLKDRVSFDRLDFDTLRHKEQQALAADLLLKETFVVFPGKMEIRPLKSPGAVNFVALAAFFRQHKGPNWKLVFDVREMAQGCGSGSLHNMVHARLFKNLMRRGKK